MKKREDSRAAFARLPYRFQGRRQRDHPAE